MDREQQIGSKLGKEYIKAVFCHPDYSTSMQSTSCKMSEWMKHKLESRFSGEISIASDTQMTESEEELKGLLMKVKEESEKVGLNSTFRKLRSWYLVPLLHGR